MEPDQPTKKLPPLPKWLQRKPEEIAAENAAQAERRAGFTRARLTEAERLIQRGVLLEETARGNLVAGAGDEQRALLAEGLALQGRYTEAATHHPDKEIRGKYGRMAAAVERPDEERCNCTDYEDDTLSLTPRYVARVVYSARHGGAVPLIVCNKCGHANARPATSRLLQQSAALTQNLAAARGGINRGVRDVQIPALRKVKDNRGT